MTLAACRNVVLGEHDARIHRLHHQNLGCDLHFDVSRSGRRKAVNGSVDLHESELEEHRYWHESKNYRRLGHPEAGALTTFTVREIEFVD